MTVLPDPVWPVIVLAVIQLVDAAMSVRPVPFVAVCLDGVRFPRRLWSLLPPIKIAAAAGLVAGIWVPVLGLAASIGLIVYFLLAIGMHLRAGDFSRYLFLNATGMLVVCVAVLMFCFLL